MHLIVQNEFLKDYYQYKFLFTDTISWYLKINLWPVFLFPFVAYRFRHTATVSLTRKE